MARNKPSNIMSGGLIDNTELKDYSETKTSPSSAAGVLILDISLGNVFEVTLTENVTTLTLSNPASSGKSCSFTLILTQDNPARTISWPASVKWNLGTAPTITTVSAIYILTFVTIDEGTIWYGFLSGSEMS